MGLQWQPEVLGFVVVLFMENEVPGKANVPEEDCFISFTKTPCLRVSGGGHR